MINIIEEKNNLSKISRKARFNFKILSKMPKIFTKRETKKYEEDIKKLRKEYSIWIKNIFTIGVSSFNKIENYFGKYDNFENYQINKLKNNFLCFRENFKEKFKEFIKMLKNKYPNEICRPRRLKRIKK